MNRRSALTALFILAAIGVVLHLAFGQEKLIPFTALTDAPRPPVHADRRTKPQLLTGLLVRREPTLVGSVNRRREERNLWAARHTEAVALWRVGRKSLREVEAIEASLWAARRRALEIDDLTLHTALIGLFEREVQRLETLFANGFAGEDQLERARLYLARERHLAGQSQPDAEGRDYEQQRVAYLAAKKRRDELLLEAGMGHPEYMQLNYEALEQEFPPLPVPETPPEPPTK